jgi:aminodeoxychorismate synthase component I
MRELAISADDLVARLLRISESEPVCILDSCGVGHLGSHLLMAGIRPVGTLQISDADPAETLRILDEKLSGDHAAVFTLSYDFGLKLHCTKRMGDPSVNVEPDAFLVVFEEVVVHDYDTSRTFVVGGTDGVDEVSAFLSGSNTEAAPAVAESAERITSNVSKTDYVDAVERIREHIRSGDTYQVNLTQQLRVRLAAGMTPQAVFSRLRGAHPAPFASFLKRPDSVVISASPERFFRIKRDRTIDTSPIKGTRPRGETQEEDARLRTELESSSKDRAENTMIVDLMRNDLGRVCDFGSVKVDKLCEVEEHPSLFHLVSTVRGKLRTDAKISDIVRALFPCGSITGAPKIRTMEIIDELESVDRGLSMGAIGVYVPEAWNLGRLGIDTVFDLSVAIRTMVIRENEAVFSVGGGVVIDSEPEKEFEESVLKAKALVDALGAASNWPQDPEPRRFPGV